MYNDIVKFLSEQKNVDDYGDTVVTTTERTVFADVRSVGQSEFYQAAAVGLRPEIKFVIADFLDYHGEKALLYTPFGDQERRYNVIRTYRTGTELEIVCNSEVNDNGRT